MSKLVEELDLPQTLQDHTFVSKDGTVAADDENDGSDRFVLYLPTVAMRAQHNPSLALATRTANHLHVPLIILYTVLDDAHHPFSLAAQDDSNIVGTSRRLCFMLQVLQAVAPQWQDLHASVRIRVHGPGFRTPHHLTLARKAIVVVMDEPFVHPYLHYVETVEKAAAHVCLRVDASTTVPPRTILTQDDGTVQLAPQKAWTWKKATASYRKRHVDDVVVHGAFDAPKVQVKASDSFLQRTLPSEWYDYDQPAPGIRAWTVDELDAMDAVAWSRQWWPGGHDVPAVPPCVQTHGAHGNVRWQHYQAHGLSQYARKRNNVTQPHAVSRLSCYLNVGAVSIFQVVHDTWQAPCDTDKFEDELVKFREHAHAHALSAGRDYYTPAILPAWARHYLEQQQHNDDDATYDLPTMARANTGDKVWDAMQTYLMETGELHNNARMSWARSVVHWNKGLPVDALMRQLCFLNDRFALDGLSPPSYGGLLWSLGWSDRPSSGPSIRSKPASKHRAGAQGFTTAKQRLLGEDAMTASSSPRLQNKRSIDQLLQQQARQAHQVEQSPLRKNPAQDARKKSAPKKIDDFFQRARDS